MDRLAKRQMKAGFTLIELLVAIAVSVILLSILAFVFRLATGATRDANSRVALTERMRSLNIRLRQEIGAMLAVQRLDGAGKPYTDKRTYEITPSTSGAANAMLRFTSATVQDGKNVSQDVRYEFVPDPGGDVEKNALVRWRDKTGNFDNVTRQVNPNYKMGDDKWELPASGPYFEADVIVKNVRFVAFKAWDIPPGFPGNPNPPDLAGLNPRELPASIELDIEFGPETGNPDMLERAKLSFPIYRGL